MAAATDTSTQTFFRLDHHNRWLGDDALNRNKNIAVDQNRGISLRAFKGGPLAFPGCCKETPAASEAEQRAHDDGSLGRLILPRGFAVDPAGALYLLDLADENPLLDAPRVRRFDHDSRRFVALPGIGGRGSGARQFLTPVNLALTDAFLYVADAGAGTVKVFHRASATLLHELRRGAGPRDVAAEGDSVLVLDAAGCVYRHTRCTERPVRVRLGQCAPKDWTRLAVDAKHRIVLARSGCADVFRRSTPAGHAYTYEKTVHDPGDLRGDFPAPILVLDECGRFCLAGNRGVSCAGPKEAGPPPELPLVHCRPGVDGSEKPVVFDRAGRKVEEDTTVRRNRRLYRGEGTWYSLPIDSALYRCQWDRIQVDLADLPPGAWFEVATHARAERDLSGREIPDDEWDVAHRETGQRDVERDPSAPAPHATDALVRSREGRFLYLRLRLGSAEYLEASPETRDQREDTNRGGPSTPVVRSMRAHFPRHSYLENLPAIFAADDESRRFLEWFLAVFQTEWDQLDDRIRAIADLFDPSIHTGEEWANYLASWLGVDLEGSWGEREKRVLLASTPQTINGRGTIEALRAHVSAYVSNIIRRELVEGWAFPRILESFRARRYFQLGAGRLGVPATPGVWSRHVVARLQTDVFDREGEVRLVGTGDAERDVFHEHAHRFRVYLPSAWVRRAADEALLRRAIRAESPAHTKHELRLVEPRFRVGVQSTVGVDTIVGGCPSARLESYCDEERPPSRPPRNLLGYDTVLSGAPGALRGVRLGASTRVGAETKLE